MVSCIHMQTKTYKLSKKLIVIIFLLFTGKSHDSNIGWLPVAVEHEGIQLQRKKDKEDFKWTNDESELLLNVTHNYS